MHNGVKETLTELRSRYWIVQGRQFVRKLLNECRICRRRGSKPLTGPPPPSLPDFHVQSSPPFTTTGIDYAGPLYLKIGEKVWFSLFTCCALRAVHLELVPDLTAKAFICCLKRFSGRCGIPQRLRQIIARPSSWLAGSCWLCRRHLKCGNISGTHALNGPSSLRRHHGGVDFTRDSFSQ